MKKLLIVFALFYLISCQTNSKNVEVKNIVNLAVIEELKNENDI
jgi:uncharacterized lipoprotein YajG